MLNTHQEPTIFEARLGSLHTYTSLNAPTAL